MTHAWFLMRFEITAPDGRVYRERAASKRQALQNWSRRHGLPAEGAVIKRILNQQGKDARNERE